AFGPERDVLHRGERVRPDEPREAAHLLGAHGVALVRHRRRALLSFAERLLDLAHLRALEAPDLERELLEAGGEEGERGQDLGVAVALEHLGCDGRRPPRGPPPAPLPPPPPPR